MATSNGWCRAIAVLALLVLAGCTSAADLTPSGDATPTATAPLSKKPAPTAPTETKLAEWQLPPPPDNRRLGYSVLRTWTYDDLLVIADRTVVTAYDRATGKQRWKATLPDGGTGDESVLCGAGTSVVSGKVALTMGLRKDSRASPICGFAILLDLASGTFDWAVQTTVEKGALGGPPEGMPVEIVGDIVVVSWDLQLFGLAIADGAKKWIHAFKGQPDNELCPTSDLMTTSSLAVLLGDCIQDDGDTAKTVFGVEAASGKVVRRIVILDADGKEPFAARLISAEPLIVSASSKNVDSRNIYAVYLDAAWKQKAQIPIGVGALGKGHTGTELDQGSPGPAIVGAYHEESRVLVRDGVMITVTIPKQGTVNALVAIELKSARRLWTAQIPNKRIMQPVALDGSSVAVAVAPKDDRRGRDPKTEELALVDLATGKVGAMKSREITSSTEGPVLIETFWYAYADERLYAVNVGKGRYAPMVFTIG